MSEQIVSMTEAAIELAERGFCIFPCLEADMEVMGKKGLETIRAKAPYTGHGFKDATRDIDTVKILWKRHPNAIIGRPTGDGVFVVDADSPAHKPDGKGADGVAAFQRLWTDHGGEWPIRTATVVTPSKGYHFYFSVNPSIKIKNDSRGKLLGEGMDVRGDGGYVIIPPSRMPDGRAYQWTNGHSIEEMPPLEAPEWLIERVRDRDEDTPRPALAERRTATKTTRGGQKVLDAEAAEVTSAPEGTRNGTLNVSACKIGNLVAGGEITMDDAREELIDAAMEAGLAYHEARATADSGLRAGLEHPRTIGSNGTTDTDEDEPVELFATPTCPLDVLPGDLKDYISDVAEACQTPEDVTWAVVMNIIGTMAGRKLRIDARTGGWHEYATIPLIVVGTSGLGKSPTIRTLMEPVRELHREMDARYRTDRKAYDEAEDKTGMDIPKRERIYVDDTTEEALALALRDSPNGILIHSDEVATFLCGLGRYNADKQALKSRLLTCLDGGDWDKTRATGEDIYIPNALVSILGGIQPGIMQKVFNDADIHNGFLTRMTFVNLILRKAPVFEMRQDHPRAEKKYAAFIRWLHDIEWDGTNTIDIPLSDAAFKAIKPTMDRAGRTAFDAQTLDGPTCSRASKSRRTLLKLCLIIHLIRSFYVQAAGGRTEIDEDTAKAALAMFDWIEKQQDLTYGRFGGKADVADPASIALMRAVLEWADHEGKAEPDGSYVVTNGRLKALAEGVGITLNSEKLAAMARKLGMTDVQNIGKKKERGKRIGSDTIQRIRSSVMAN